MLLVDTSAWIEVFRRDALITIDDVAADRDLIATCLPIIQEVLQGFDDERAFKVAQTAMYALPCVEPAVTRAVVDDAIDLYRRARRGGLTVRSGVDCLIAACASRYGMAVVHCDRDFTQLARIAPLQHVDLAPLLRQRAARAKH